MFLLSAVVASHFNVLLLVVFTFRGLLGSYVLPYLALKADT